MTAEPLALAGQRKAAPAWVRGLGAWVAALDERLAATGIAFGAGLVFLLAGPAKVHDTYAVLARALLSGHLSVPFNAAEEMVPAGHGMGYVPFPPVPAIPYALLDVLRVPVTGKVDDAILTAIAGAAAVALTFLLMCGMRVRPAPTLWVEVGVAGTLLWIAGTGGTWLYAQVLAAAFTLGALNLAVRDRAPLVAGLLIGLAAGSRLPTLLTIPLLVYLYRRRWPRLGLLTVGVTAVLLPIAAYNLVRFGSPTEFGYGMIVSWNGVPTVMGEQWYSNGIESVTYIPRSIAIMLFSGVHVVTGAPWIHPDWSGLSIVFTAPLTLIALGGWRSRLGAVAIATAVLVMVPDWMHGNWGFYQYGYRFILDALPALLIAAAIAYRERVSPPLISAVMLTIVVNAFGLWASGANLMVGPSF